MKKIIGVGFLVFSIFMFSSCDWIPDYFLTWETSFQYFADVDTTEITFVITNSGKKDAESVSLSFEAYDAENNLLTDKTRGGRTSPINVPRGEIRGIKVFETVTGNATRVEVTGASLFEKK